MLSAFRRAAVRLSAPARATDRFEFRLQAKAEATIAAAASALGMDASDFARDVLFKRANEVLAERAVKTTVPASFFKELLTAPDAPADANDALRRSTAAARQNITAEHLHP